MKEFVKHSLTNREKKALREIKNFINQTFGESKVFVYGSKAYGESTQESDLDFAVNRLYYAIFLCYKRLLLSKR